MSEYPSMGAFLRLMEKQKLEKLYQKCFDLWGADAQLLMLTEEATEMALATLHLRRHSKNVVESRKNLASEFADVKIMMSEIEWFLGPDFTGMINFEMDRKLARLEERIKKAEKRVSPKESEK